MQNTSTFDLFAALKDNVMLSWKEIFDLPFFQGKPSLEVESAILQIAEFSCVSRYVNDIDTELSDSNSDGLIFIGIPEDPSPDETPTLPPRSRGCTSYFFSTPGYDDSVVTKVEYFNPMLIKEIHEDTVTEVMPLKQLMKEDEQCPE